MAVSATAKDTGISVKKMLPIVDLVRGMNVEEALNALEFLPSPAAATVARVVKSAAANAENEDIRPSRDLTITRYTPTRDQTLKRFRARARAGRPESSSAAAHITVVVDEDEEISSMGQKTHR